MNENKIRFSSIEVLIDLILLAICLLAITRMQIASVKEKLLIVALINPLLGGLLKFLDSLPRLGEGVIQL